MFASPLASPALLIRTSGTRPPRTRASTARLTAARSRTSTWASESDTRCAVPSSAARRSKRSARSAQRIRSAPSAAKRRAHASPIPELAPVTSISFPLTRFIPPPRLRVTPLRDVSTRRRFCLSHVSCVPQGIAARLRPYTQPVWLSPHFYAVCQLPRLGVEHVHLFVVATRHPKLLPVGAHVPHVGTAAAGNRPRRHDASGPRVEHADGPGPVTPPRSRVPATVRDVHEAPVAARRNPMRPLPGCNESEAPESLGVLQKHAVRLHVGDVEHPAVRRRADVLRHARAVQSPGGEGQVADHGAGLEIDLHQLPRKLAGRDREPPVRREFQVIHPLAAQRDRLHQRHRLSVP